MRQVTQEFLERGEGDQTVGDCMRAAFASLLDLPLDEVPHWVDIYINVDDHVVQEMWDEVIEFVEAYRPGMTLNWVEAKFPIYTSGALPYVILTGKSPRGDWNHCVLVDSETGELAWDPHPSGGGVLEPLVNVMCLVSKETPKPYVYEFKGEN